MQEEDAAAETEKQWPEERTEKVGALEAQGGERFQRSGWPFMCQMHRSQGR